jgi:hypothetical protein
MNAIQEIILITALSITVLILIACGKEITISQYKPTAHVSGYVKDVVIDHTTQPYEGKQ